MVMSHNLSCSLQVKGPFFRQIQHVPLPGILVLWREPDVLFQNDVTKYSHCLVINNVLRSKIPRSMVLARVESNLNNFKKCYLDCLNRNPLHFCETVAPTHLFSHQSNFVIRCFGLTSFLQVPSSKI